MIPHGVRRPAELAEGQQDSRRENMILFVGALQTRKNVLRLIEAFERAASSSRDQDAVQNHWRLVLAGAPSGYQSGEILARIQESSCRDRIELAGYISESDLEGLYSRASIFALPSLDEGFGIPVLEAMAHGVPVITSNRSALIEVAGDAALLIDPCTVDELECALKRLMKDPGLRGKLSDLGRVRAKCYTWDRAVKATHSVYQEFAS